MRKKIGIIVNPIAGMGGSVGLKGTDGKAYRQALALRAHPVTPARTRSLLSHITRKEEIELFVAPGAMGEEYVNRFVTSCAVVGRTNGGRVHPRGSYRGRRSPGY